MVLRADPGVTLPGLILGSSINWCMAWVELLLSVFFPVCNGSIAGVPCSCYEDHLGYYKLFLRAGEPEARSSQLHMCWVTSKGCACSAEWNSGQKSPSFLLWRKHRFWFVPLWSVMELRRQKICLPRAEAAKCISAAAWLHKHWGCRMTPGGGGGYGWAAGWAVRSCSLSRKKPASGFGSPSS